VEEKRPVFGAPEGDRNRRGPTRRSDEKRLQINWYDDSGETISTETTPYTRALGERELTLRASSPAGAAHAVLFIGGFGALNEGEVMEFYVDAIQFIAGPRQ
jgi:hypothetical protein